MSIFTTQDGMRMYYKDWETGQPVVFCHGWPLSADAFEDQMFFLASKGYRCIAFDRRGHGRSDQTWEGNDAFELRHNAALDASLTTMAARLDSQERGGRLRDG